MPVPLPAPQVPPGFPPRATPAPSAPRITAAGGPTGCQGSQTAPYTEPGRQTTPYTEAGNPTAPSGGPTSLIAYTRRPRQHVTPSLATPPRRPTMAVPMTPLVNPHPMVTRAKDGFRLPRDRLTLVPTASLSPPSAISTSVRAALADLNHHAAMEEEYGALMSNGTWELVPWPRGSNVVTDK
jgi:hypothetical protein